MTSENVTDKENLETLLRLRRSIDNIDASIIYMLSERFKCTKEIGLLKARCTLPPSDPKREEDQRKRLNKIAQDASLNTEFVENLFKFIIKEVVKNHKNIIDINKNEKNNS